MANGIGIINGFDLFSKSPIDKKYGYYTGNTISECLTNANTAIPSPYRYEGLTVGVKVGSGSVIEYWYTNGTTDTDLKVKTLDLSGYTSTSSFNLHTGNTSNPHATTANQVGAYSTTEIDTKLSSKSDTGHTHNYLPLTGGNINGNLKVNGDISGTTFYGDGSKLTGIQTSGGGGSGNYLPLSGGTLTGDLHIKNSLISYNQKIIDVTGNNTIFTLSSDDCDAFFVDYVVRKGSNLRAGTLTVVNNGLNTELTEYATNDLGSTSDIDFFSDVNNGLNLKVNASSSGWIIKYLLKTIGGVLQLPTYPPTTIINSVSLQGETTALVSGTITSNGGTTILSKGVCWSSSNPNPVSGNTNTITSSDVTNNISETITGLSNQTYYVRTFAVNSQGISYSDSYTYVHNYVPQQNRTQVYVAGLFDTNLYNIRFVALDGPNLSDNEIPVNTNITCTLYYPSNKLGTETISDLISIGTSTTVEREVLHYDDTRPNKKELMISPLTSGLYDYNNIGIFDVGGLN